MRNETENSHVKIYKSNSKDRLEQNCSEQNGVHCCQFINNASRAKNKKEIVTVKVNIKTNEMPSTYREGDFVKKYIDFANTLGLNITLEKHSSGHWAVYSGTEIEKTFFNLFNLNVIRYLWSPRFDKLPKIIMDLRNDESLATLDSWEIFQLAHHVNHNNHFHDMSPVKPSTSAAPVYITSQEFLTRRLHYNMGSNQATFNIDAFKNVKYATVNKALKVKDYMGMYNALSPKKLGQSEFSHVTCINNEDFEKELRLNTPYVVIRTMKNLVKIANSNYKIKLYNMKRFNKI